MRGPSQRNAARTDISKNEPAQSSGSHKPPACLAPGLDSKFKARLVISHAESVNRRPVSRARRSTPSAARLPPATLHRQRPYSFAPRLLPPGCLFEDARRQAMTGSCPQVEIRAANAAFCRTTRSVPVRIESLTSQPKSQPEANLGRIAVLSNSPLERIWTESQSFTATRLAARPVVGTGCKGQGFVSTYDACLNLDSNRMGAGGG